MQQRVPQRVPRRVRQRVQQRVQQWVPQWVPQRGVLRSDAPIKRPPFWKSKKVEVVISRELA